MVLFIETELLRRSVYFVKPRSKIQINSLAKKEPLTYQADQLQEGGGLLP